MSVYDSTNSASGDSDATRRAKRILTTMLTEKLRLSGFKSTVKQEVPAFFDVPYHADLGVLMRSVELPDQYFFFIVEIDSKLGHRTPLKDRREDERAMKFIFHNYIITIRINLEEIVGSRKKTETELYEKIWSVLKESLVFSSEINIYKNTEFAVRLKENAFTKCRGCDHPAAFHNLNGCDYKQTNKLKLKCLCNEPFFRSDA